MTTAGSASAQVELFRRDAVSFRTRKDDRGHAEGSEGVDAARDRALSRFACRSPH